MRGCGRMTAQQALLAAAAAIAIVASASPAYAQTRTFDVPAGPASRTIPIFAKQAGIQVLASGDTVKAARTKAVRGNLSVADALARLLEGTGLAPTATPTADGIVTIARRTVGNGSAAADSAASSGDDGNGSEKSVAEILVVGKRSQNVDIRRTRDDAQPYVVFIHDQIERSGANNLDDFLKTRLPMSSQSQSTNQTGYSSSVNEGQINLRGLGTDQTLILIDGRRVPNIGLSFDGFGQPVITGIPLPSIERVEILPTTAGGIYGGSATGGVVNIILKHNYNGVDLQANYGLSGMGDSSRYNIYISGGGTLQNGRTQLSFGVSLGGGRPLYQDQRRFALKSRQLFLKNDSTAYSFVPPISSTGNICSVSATPAFFCDGGNLTLDTGQALGSAFTYIPLGYAGPQADGGQALLKNAGSYNLNPALGAVLLSPSRTRSATADIRHDFGDHVTAYFSGSLDRSSEPAPILAAVRAALPADNPNNPFQQDIWVTFPVGLLDGDRKTENSMLRAGTIVRLPASWSASLEYQWSRSKSETVTMGTPSLLTGVPPGGAELDYLQQIALTDTSGIRTNLDLLDTQTVRYGPLVTTLNTASFRTGGDLFHLPGGTVTMTGLLEWRGQRVSDVLETTTAGTVSGTGSQIDLYPARRQNVYSGYAELRLPLFSKANSRALFRELEITSSIRHDRYEDSIPVGPQFYSFFPATDFVRPSLSYASTKFRSTDYTVGVRYIPIKGLELRGSWATGFRPPSLSQLSPTLRPLNPFTAAILRDPLRGNSSLQAGIPTIQFGNANLDPERSRSFSIGAVISPKSVKGLRVSVDYTRIAKRGEIYAGDFQFFLQNESGFPGRITRGPLTDADRQLGYTGGPVTAIDASYINLSSTLVKALDIQLDYSVDLGNAGSLQPFLIASHQISLLRRPTPDSVATNQVDRSDGPLSWRGNAGIIWHRKAWTLELDAQYYDSYSVCASVYASDTCKSFIEPEQGRGRIPSQVYADLRISADLGKLIGSPIAKAITLTLGVQNVFNKTPPIISAGLSDLGYSTYGDPRLRRFTLSIQKHFGR